MTKEEHFIVLFIPRCHCSSKETSSPSSCCLAHKSTTKTKRVQELFFLGLRARALSDQEEKAAANQKMLEMDNQLAALSTSGQALYDVVLGADRRNAQLVLRLDEARLQVDPLIFERIHGGIRAALTSVGLHYNGIDFDAVGPRGGPTTISLPLVVPPLVVGRILWVRC